MKKKLFLLIICFITILISGCSKKVALSSDEVFSILSKKGYSVADITDKYDFATSAYYMSEPFVFNYVKSDEKNKIKGIFIDECNNIQNSIGEDHDRKMKSTGNYALYTEDDGTYYYYAAYLDGSYITIKGSEKMKEDIIDLAEELGY